MDSKKIGYIRVSSKDQYDGRQLEKSLKPCIDGPHREKGKSV